MTLWWFALSLLAVVAGAEAFTNGLEVLGARLHWSEGTMGSLFAAVATALPETTVPVIAWLGPGPEALRTAVATGAVVGAPLMLASLAFAAVGAAAWLWRGRGARIALGRGMLTRDLAWFIGCETIALLALWLPAGARSARDLTGVLLAGLYVAYGWGTWQTRAPTEGEHASLNLHASGLGLKSTSGAAGLQALIGVTLTIIGTRGFVAGVEHLSGAVPPLVWSLVIIPVATELPEKMNGVLWIRRHRDALALGNVSGALVFQSTVLPALGLWLTPWRPVPQVLMAMAVTLALGLYVLILARRHQDLSATLLTLTASGYAVYGLWVAHTLGHGLS